MSMFRVSSTVLRQKAQELEQMNKQFDAAVKALAAARARQAYMLVDSSKFGRIGAAAVLHADEAAIITDRAPGREFQDYTEVTVV